EQHRIVLLSSTRPAAGRHIAVPDSSPIAIRAKRWSAWHRLHLLRDFDPRPKSLSLRAWWRCAQAGALQRTRGEVLLKHPRILSEEKHGLTRIPKLDRCRSVGVLGTPPCKLRGIA